MPTQRNIRQLLAVARDVVAQYGADASLRDIARKAGVGLGTLYRHFPTREALLEALLRENLDELTRKASELGGSEPPDEALASWFREGVAFSQTYSGIVALLAAALDDPHSALHASCSTMRAAGARLLERAQNQGTARTDIDGADLLALIAAAAWLYDQPGFATRAERLSQIIMQALLRSESPRSRDRVRQPEVSSA